MDLFNAKFDDKKVEVIKVKSQTMLYSREGRYLFQALDNRNYLLFQDGDLNKWAYAKHGWTVKVPGFYCEDLPVGTHKIKGEKGLFIRVPTPEEILEKAENYFLPLAIKEELPEKTINLRKMDTDFSLN